MKSGGKVEAAGTMDVTKAAAAMFRGISGVQNAADVPAAVKSADAFVAGSHAAFQGMTRTGGGINAARFADRAPTTSSIKGDTPRVQAMAAVLGNEKLGDARFELLARALREIA